jgi:hypothetical protein
MTMTTPPAGVILDNSVPIYGGMKTGNLILNGDMELTEFVSPLWKPSLFTFGVVPATAATWERLATGVYAGTYSLMSKLTALAVGKPSYFYQVVPLNPGCQRDQLRLWHKFSYVQKCDTALVTTAVIRVSFDLVSSTGSLVNLLTWTSACYDSGWTPLSREFRPSDYATEAQMLAAVELRVTVNVWPTSAVGGPVAYFARFDDVVLEAQCTFDRNFAVGGVFDHERDSVQERGSDQNRTMYQTSSGRGTAKRQGTIPFTFITELQRDHLHGIWLYSGRQYATWYPVMETYPESVDIWFDRKWSFKPAHANVEVGHNGVLTWMER